MTAMRFGVLMSQSAWKPYVKLLLKVLVYFGQYGLLAHCTLGGGGCFVLFWSHLISPDPPSPPPPAALCWTNKKGHLSAANACLAAVRVDGALAGFHWHNEEFNIPLTCVTNNVPTRATMCDVRKISNLPPYVGGLAMFMHKHLCRRWGAGLVLSENTFFCIIYLSVSATL